MLPPLVLRSAKRVLKDESLTIRASWFETHGDAVLLTMRG
jgi:hypothetical protein